MDKGMKGEAVAKHGDDSQNGLEEIIGHQARTLTPEETAKLDKDKTLISEYKQRKFELEAQKNWDLFYKRNTTKFFKDRHWTKREFSELISEKQVGFTEKNYVQSISLNQMRILTMFSVLLNWPISIAEIYCLFFLTCLSELGLDIILTFRYFINSLVILLP